MNIWFEQIPWLHPCLLKIQVSFEKESKSYRKVYIIINNSSTVKDANNPTSISLWKHTEFVIHHSLCGAKCIEKLKSSCRYACIFYKNVTSHLNLPDDFMKTIIVFIK